ncbi:MAG: dihydrolipoyl dehydrogenase [Candidatus Aminicenantaceae bacterium]
MQRNYDIIIIGGGPGGYVSALRGAQLKKEVALIEKERIGGTCMNRGCIPTKYLLHQTKIFSELRESKTVDGPLDELRVNLGKIQKEKRKVVEQFVKGLLFLLEKNGVEVIKGEASLKDERRVSVLTGEEEKIIEGNAIVLAAGSHPSELPFLIPDGEKVVTSREALEFEDIPQKMLIIGAGAIGIELGTFYQRLGTDVSIIEIMPTILPGWDREVVSRLERVLKSQGLKIFTHMRIEKSHVKKDFVTLKGVSLKDDTSFELQGNRVLLATGRRPNSEFLKSAGLNILLDQSDFVRVTPQLETNIPGVYAIGDLIGGKLLAHKASHEGIVAAENISGAKRTINYDALPIAVYTEPEFSSVGLTEEEALNKGIKTKIGRFPLRANSRALTMERPDGMVKVMADEKDKIIGAHILAPNASEIITEISLAIASRMKIHDIASLIHIHPSISEAVMEASMKAKGAALHILNI